MNQNVKQRFSKTEFIEMLRNEFPLLLKKDLSSVFLKTLDLIKSNVRKGHELAFLEFGCFKQIKMKETTRRHPKTKEIFKVPARKKAKFYPSKYFLLG